MTMSREAGFVDANVLVYAVDKHSPQYAVSRALLDEARKGSATLFVSSQVLCELFSILTSARRVLKPLSPDNALRAISDFLGFLKVVPIPAQTVEGWIELARRRTVKGGEIFDLQIVATMKSNGILRIYTFNKSDFEVFAELEVVTP